MAGRFDDACELLERSGGILHEVHVEGVSAACSRVAAQTMELLGDRAGAEQELVVTVQRLRDTGRYARGDARALIVSCHLAQLYCDDGRWNDAAGCLEYDRDAPVPSFFLHEAVLGLAARARVAAHRGALTEAVALGERAVELGDRSDFLNLRAGVWLALAEVRRAAGRPVEAGAALGEALQLYEAKGNVAAAERLQARAAI
jgi:hypothetical protein